jgi:hypothetical protein
LLIFPASAVVGVGHITTCEAKEGLFLLAAFDSGYIAPAIVDGVDQQVAALANVT